ncbi:MAG TPA: hypothetical protein V6C96_03335 [Vampirovibrionales bacterium]
MENFFRSVDFACDIHNLIHGFSLPRAERIALMNIPESVFYKWLSEFMTRSMFSRESIKPFISRSSKECQSFAQVFLSREAFKDLLLRPLSEKGVFAFLKSLII